jgi:hypothetical protein
MARPIKQGVDYFPHFNTDGKTLYILEGKYGNDGYALWFKVLELLSRAPGHVYDCGNIANWEFLCQKSHLPEQKSTEILNTCADLDAIDVKLWKEKRIIWCQNLVENLKPVYDKRKQSVPEKPVIDTETPKDGEFSGQKSPEMPQRKEEKSRERRVEESKEEKREEPSPSPSDEDDIFEILNQEKIPVMAEEVIAACRKFTAEWVKGAIKEAVVHEKRSWRYIAGVLNICLEEGHAPGQRRASNKARAAPGGGGAADKYTNGKFSHLVQH